MNVELLTIDQVADILGVHPRTVSNWCENGQLRHIRLPSGRVRVRTDDLADLLTPEDVTP